MSHHTESQLESQLEMAASWLTLLEKRSLFCNEIVKLRMIYDDAIKNVVGNETMCPIQLVMLFTLLNVLIDNRELIPSEERATLINVIEIILITFKQKADVLTSSLKNKYRECNTSDPSIRYMYLRNLGITIELTIRQYDTKNHG